jgi:ketosteroid isomerase-like protein
MTNEDLDQAEQNKATIRQFYDAIARGDRESLKLLIQPGFTTVHAPGHPVGGTFKGSSEIVEAGRRSQALFGPTKIRVKELIADSPSRVVAVVEVSGIDASGEPWSVSAVELADVIDGKLAQIELFVDTARLHDIAEQREFMNQAGR